MLAAPIGLAAGVANAGMMFAIVDEVGGDVRMDARALDGVFGDTPTNFSDSALLAIHMDIAGDVDTSGRVSFALLQTDSGLAFATLVDQPDAIGGPRGEQQNQLSMLTTAPLSTDAFINDDGSDLGAPFTLGGRNVVGGDFVWSGSNDPADAFAWAGLGAGDFVNASFTQGDNSLLTRDVFQFLSYNADAEAWEIVATSNFSSADQFSYSAQIIPAPAGLFALGAVGLTAARRRRR